MEEETAFMAFEGTVPVETVQEDNAIETQEEILPQSRTSGKIIRNPKVMRIPELMRITKVVMMN